MINTEIFNRMEYLIQTYKAVCYVAFDWGDKSTVGMVAHNITIYSGDWSDTHRHRFDFRTGHGYTEIEEMWQAGDKSLSCLERALNKFEKKMNSNYECEECAQIIENVLREAV